MNEVLERRYSVLFRAYDVGGRDDLGRVKAQLLRNRGAGVNLRADAALFLLTLYDQMIIRPYVGPIVTEGAPEGLAVPQMGNVRPEFETRIERSLALIFKELEGSGAERPCSSHEALRAIERAWPQLVVLFGWG